MSFREFAKDNIVILDGAMGSLLQKNGLKPGEIPERWNVSHPDIITGIHESYFDAGSNVVYTCTFGLNRLKFEEAELRQLAFAAVENAKKARDNSIKKSGGTENNKFIAFDIGPCGKLLKPYGDFEFEECVSLFAELARIAEESGADLISIETMNDSYETKAAVLAAKENSSLPILVTNAYGEDGKLMTGANCDAMYTLLEGLGAEYIGANCSLGPEKLYPVIDRLVEISDRPTVFKPNAGMPKIVDGKTVYDISPEEFAEQVRSRVEKGAGFVGGCCGTSPEYIRAISLAVKGMRPLEIKEKNSTRVSSYTHAVEVSDDPVLIGERINPTGKKRFKQALAENDINYILQEGIKQQECGVHILDVNVGMPEIDEAGVLTSTVEKLQAVCDVPLQIDTANPDAMEKALRVVNGKAMINSVNGKHESMESIFPLAKKYGGVVICLTLDENGIPETAEGRLRIAERIVKKAEEYGIKRKDLIFDTLTLTISSERDSAKVTLDSIRLIREKLGCRTSLGVSNISFGLPNRTAVNVAFFNQALCAGLGCAIMNPYSQEMMNTYYAYRALNGFDENLEDYIKYAQQDIGSIRSDSQNDSKSSIPGDNQAGIMPAKEADLDYAIRKGLREKAGELTKILLNEENNEPLSVVSEIIIPALDKVGKGFEDGSIFLPQLLMSAEAAQAAFEEIRARMPKTQETAGEIVVVATVEGDIHDIGKNIAKLLLENYGFRVIDLGRDVKPETVVDAVKQYEARFCGLSALMTTTVPAMEKTIKLLKKECPETRIVVGGAVLTAEYAAKIGSDGYAKDAMETVRFCK